MIWSRRGPVTLNDDLCSWSACFEGMVIPSPPILADKANKARSRSLGGGFPVGAGITLVCRASSSGLNFQP